MEVKDLRIGNIILDDEGGIVVVEQLTSKLMKNNHLLDEQVAFILLYSCDTNIKECDINRCKGIQLTENILLDCGMHKSIWSATRFIFNDEQFHIDILNGRFVFRGLGMSVVYVDFLHDLQNIYFAVRRKELEYKKSD